MMDMLWCVARRIGFAAPRSAGGAALVLWGAVLAAACDTGSMPDAGLSCPLGSRACADATGRQFCTNVSTDPAHCGSCGHACASGEVCSVSRCIGAFELPRPTGPYGVGVETRFVTDPARVDAQAPQPNSPRTLQVHVIYPSDADAGGVAAPYLPPTVADAYAAAFAGFAGDGILTPPARFPERWEVLVRTQLRLGVGLPSDGARFPVVLFGHGMGGVTGFYTTTLQDLASNGFVVVAVDHTWDTELVVFPDGGTASVNIVTTWLPGGTLGCPQAGPCPWDDHVGVWVADERFVLDEVTRWAQSDPLLAGRLDLGRVGVFGHSYGGATAMELCGLDARFKACMNLDGAHYSPERRDGGRSSAVPIMVQSGVQARLSALCWNSMTNTLQRAQADAYRLTLSGATHFAFTDYGLLANQLVPGTGSDVWGTVGVGGDIDQVLALRIVNAYTLAFFQKHLLGLSAPLLADGGQSPYPEVTFSKVR